MKLKLQITDSRLRLRIIVCTCGVFEALLDPVLSSVKHEVSDVTDTLMFKEVTSVLDRACFWEAYVKTKPIRPFRTH
jgi:hypothetical protein